MSVTVSLPDLGLERGATGHTDDGAASRTVLPWLLLATDGPSLCARDHESALDRRTHGLRATRKGFAPWPACKPRVGSYVRRVGHGSFS